MKKTIKTLSLILAFLMVSFVAAGCKKKNEQPAESTVSTETKVYGEYGCEIPDGLNFGDTEVTILCRDAIGQSDEFVSAGMTSNIISDAVYTRNLAVEGMLGVKLKQIPMKDSVENNHSTVIMEMRTSVLGGTDDYNIVAAPLYTMMNLLPEGMYYDLKTVDYLNLDKYYWAQGFNKWAKIGNSQYIATGSVALSLYRFMYVTVYNNEFFKNNGLEDIYDLVKSNSWTIEKQKQMVADLYDDTGSVAGSRDEKDQYGFVSGARTTVDAYLEAWNLNFIGRSSDGFYSYNSSLNKFSGIADQMLELFYDKEGSYIIPYGKDNTDNADILKIFSNEKTAMATMKIHAIETGLRNQAFEYSIAPLPKYDSNQENYGTLVQDQVTALAVPVTVSKENSAMIGAVMEALASESYKNTYPAYFETALSYQYLQNAESVEMLKVIYESVGFQTIFSCYATGVSLNSILREVANSEVNTISHQLASYKNIASDVEEYNQKLKDMIAKQAAQENKQ